MTAHHFRRLVFLWAPAFLTGIALMADAAHLTNTTNGLTVVGSIVALTGLGAAAYDNKETT